MKRVDSQFFKNINPTPPCYTNSELDQPSHGTEQIDHIKNILTVKTVGIGWEKIF